MDNAEIADQLDAFAAVLELGDANPYTIAPTGVGPSRSATARPRSPSWSPRAGSRASRHRRRDRGPPAGARGYGTDRGARRARARRRTRARRSRPLSRAERPARHRHRPRAWIRTAGELREAAAEAACARCRGSGPRPRRRSCRRWPRRARRYLAKACGSTVPGSSSAGSRVLSMPSPRATCGAGVTPAAGSP